MARPGIPYDLNSNYQILNANFIRFDLQISNFYLPSVEVSTTPDERLEL